MTQIKTGDLTFTFAQGATVAEYDDWKFYRKQFIKAFNGPKAVDLIYVGDQETWLIEVKDYRRHRFTKLIELKGKHHHLKSIGLGEKIAFKVRDTLAGLVAAKCYASDPDEKHIAKKALSRDKLRVVLHLEQSEKHSRLFPEAINPQNMELKLRQLLKAVDAHPKVVNQSTSAMPWRVRG